jgi:hypothetical protein
MSANGVNDITVVPMPVAGQIARTDFGGHSVETRAETAATAMAAAAEAAIKAAYVMAMRRPRNHDNVRVLLLKACEHPAFAYLARFRKPVGMERNEETGEWEEKIAEGLSIRFAEEAARVMGNLHMTSDTIYDDAKKKLVKFETIDLENNTIWGKTVTIERTVERKNLKKGQQALGQRMNSYGEAVYIVEATPAEVTKNEGAEGSKAWRDQILKSVPAHVKGSCLQKINEVLLNEAAVDPDKKKKEVVDAFAKIGVLPIHLQEYLGHELVILSPAEIVDLNTIYVSIEQGETSWAEISDQRREVRGGKPVPGAAAAKPVTASRVGSVDAALADAKKKREQAAAATAKKPDPANAITKGDGSGKGKPAAPPPLPEFVLSTSKQRRDIAQAAIDAHISMSDVIGWFGKSSTEEFSFDQAAEALAKIMAVTGEVPEEREPGSDG